MLRSRNTTSVDRLTLWNYSNLKMSIMTTNKSIGKQDRLVETMFIAGNVWKNILKFWKHGLLSIKLHCLYYLQMFSCAVDEDDEISIKEAADMIVKAMDFKNGVQVLVFLWQLPKSPLIEFIYCEVRGQLL